MRSVHLPSDFGRYRFSTRRTNAWLEEMPASIRIAEPQSDHLAISTPIFPAPVRTFKENPVVDNAALMPVSIPM